MTLNSDITKAIKQGRVLFGVNSAKRTIHDGKVDMIVVAENCPAAIASELENLSKLSGFKLQFFGGSNVELGTLCKKTFPVSVLVVRAK